MVRLPGRPTRLAIELCKMYNIQCNVCSREINHPCLAVAFAGLQSA